MNSRSDVLIMAKPAGPQCNLACAYCYYLDKSNELFAGKPGVIPEHWLDQYIQERLESSTQTITHFEWHGGEPTILGLEFFQRVVALQRKHARPGRAFTNGIQTNGVLIDSGWADFLRDEGFSVGLSIDGPACVHDRYRVDRGGGGSHAHAMRAWRLLRDAGVHTDVLCVVHSANATQPEAVHRFFREEGVRHLQFLPLVEKLPGGEVTDRTARPGDVGAFLCAVFDLWIARDLGSMVVQTFDEAFRVTCGEPHALCVFRQTCGDVWVLEHDGALYACDHFVDREHRLGTLSDPGLPALIEGGAAREFGRDKRAGLPRQCLACDVLEFCNGGCPKDRISTTTDGESGLNYLCEAWRRFFRHARPELERLALHWKAGRPVREFRASPAPKKRLAPGSKRRK